MSKSRIKQVRGLQVGDVIEYDRLERTKDIDFIVTGFPSRKTVKAKAKDSNLIIVVSIDRVKSEFLKENKIKKK